MARIPSVVQSDPISGLERIHQGKVRDTYSVPGHDDLLLVVATDRLSIFDFVLAALVLLKGQVLTAMNHFWRGVLADVVPHDLMAAGAAIDPFLPEHLRQNPELQKRAVVVRRLTMIPAELIVRNCHTGSAVAPYVETGRVCGHQLPKGLQDGDQLPYLLFTPSTKAEVGHDEHINDVDGLVAKWGAPLERLPLQLFAMAQARARKRGIMLADTKFEIGRNGAVWTLADEVFTPDSSRFWDMRDWLAMQTKSKRTSPDPFDKQLIRNAGIKSHIQKDERGRKRETENEDDLAFVQAWAVPQDLLDDAARRYRYIFWRLTGLKLEAYQRLEMGIDVGSSTRRVEVLSGSTSDESQMVEGMTYLVRAMEAGGVGEVNRHVISCHRNWERLVEYARTVQGDVTIVAGAGLAAALPGMLKAILSGMGKGHIPVIGVGLEGKTERANLAAQTSIEELPNQPVELRQDGSAFFGPRGFYDACRLAVTGEFLPAKPSPDKPAQMNLPLIPVVK